MTQLMFIGGAKPRPQPQVVALPGILYSLDTLARQRIVQKSCGPLPKW